MRTAILLVPALLAAGVAHAATPEIQRPTGAPQANGTTHLVRAIPEACAWLQGTFTGDAATPYTFDAVRSSSTCQQRARFVDATKAMPSEASGWKLNDIVRIPSKDCAGLTAVVQVWRKPAASQPPKLDAQGRARIYLQDAKADAGKAPAVAMYAASMTTEGRSCAAPK